MGSNRAAAEEEKKPQGLPAGFALRYRGKREERKDAG